MGGVDRNYKMHTHYCVCLKTCKVYKYIFWFLLNVPITNTLNNQVDMYWEKKRETNPELYSK